MLCRAWFIYPKTKIFNVKLTDKIALLFDQIAIILRPSRKCDKNINSHHFDCLKRYKVYQQFPRPFFHFIEGPQVNKSLKPYFIQVFFFFNGDGYRVINIVPLFVFHIDGSAAIK